ncbi:MAG: DUF58 domain-containing protein [Proteobacteria bacterium]|nr:DUF58 domain-containing protein [Pseudomonadota bacterium]
MEFEESRPYSPGDDIRHFDWNALARTGEPFVKHYREERDATLSLALDVSASMAFGTTGRTKASTAAEAAALLAAAAGQAGDRVGLLCFADRALTAVPAARGRAHVGRVIELLFAASQAPGGGTRLATAADSLDSATRRASVVVLLSDFRDDALLTEESSASSALARMARHRDLVAAVLQDPRERELPRVGLLRLADPERPGRSVWLDTGSDRVRRRYRQAAEARRHTLEARLRGAGAEPLWLRTDRDPLQALQGFFQRRAARLHRGAA